MTWHTAPFASWDLETTGVDPESARIVTSTLVRVHGPNTEVDELLVNPGVPIPDEAAAIHGITDEIAQVDGIDPATACALILADLDKAWTGGRPVVIYNASYDLTVLDRKLRRHCSASLDGVIGPVIDPFCIDKALDPYRRGKRTLTACCEHYGVRLDGAHTSTGDALASARLAWRLAQVYPDQLTDLSKVNALQAGWRATWAVDFEDYLRRQGKHGHIDGHWPLRPYAPGHGWHPAGLSR